MTFTKLFLLSLLYFPDITWKLLLTLHQFNISTLVFLLTLFMALFVVLTGLALLESLVSDPAMRSGQELFNPSGN